MYHYEAPLTRVCEDGCDWLVGAKAPKEDDMLDRKVPAKMLPPDTKQWGRLVVTLDTHLFLTAMAKGEHRDWESMFTHPDAFGSARGRNNETATKQRNA